jgi:DNA-binding NarL/FixJ family response regulator
MESRLNPKSAVSLLIVDDHTLFREGLLLMFRIHGMAAVFAAECQEAPIAAQQHKSHVVILSLGPKHSHAWSTAQTICTQSPDIHLLILDDSVRTRNVRRTLALRIPGYWTKHAAFEQISEAVCRLAAGERSFCPEVDKYLYSTRHGLRYDPAHTGNPLQLLTPREIELLTLLAEGLTLNQCAQRMGISINTVDNHKTRLMRKLGVHKNVELARLAVREGLLMED